MQTRTLRVLVILALVGPLPARADIPEYPVEQPKPFGQHTITPTLSFGLGVGSSGVNVNIGAGFGYFVLDGLEPGITSDVFFGSDINTTITLMGYLRYFPYRSFRFSLFIRATGGRWFVIDDRDIWSVGPTLGAVFMFNSFIGMQLEGGFSYLIPDRGLNGERDCRGSCWLPVVSLGLVFSFNPVRMSRASTLRTDD
jgi:hypothetical protein